MHIFLKLSEYPSHLAFRSSQRIVFYYNYNGKLTKGFKVQRKVIYYYLYFKIMSFCYHKKVW